MQRGFSLVEVLAGIVILSLVVTTSLAVMYEREQRLREAEATVLAWQAIANETELLRRIPFTQLQTRHGKPFQGDLAILKRVPDAGTRLQVTNPKPNIREIVLTVTWSGETKKAEASMVRTNTGGENLW
jgi:prepilin-type N-terminal cleavage/methylation domain-containing protein